MRQVQQIMGLPITIDIPSAKQANDFEPSFSLLNDIDEQFSTYKSDSEVSRYARGELKAPSQKLASVIKDCKKYQVETDGYFSAWVAGSFDPSGYVKGWAIKQAGQAIQKQGFQTYCISAGGDILAKSNKDKIWQIGIQDPTTFGKILDLLSISNGAVATSGSYERGAHLINPKTRKPANELLSVTVIGPNIIKADVLATAVFVMGTKGFSFIESQPEYEALIVNKSGKIVQTTSYHSRGSSQ